MLESIRPVMVAATLVGLLMSTAAPITLVAHVARTLSTAIEKIVRAPDMQTQLLQLGAEPLPLSGPAFAKFLQDETGRWSDAVRISGAKVD